MLRIVRNDVDARRVVLILQGSIVAEWTTLLERECAELGGSGHRVTLDLSGVAFIGRAGFEALGRLSRAGVGIVGCSPLIADMLEQEGIVATRKHRGAIDGRRPRKRRGVPDT